MNTCTTGLTEVTAKTINVSLRNFEELVEKSDTAFELACDRYVADMQGKMFTGMLWWKKPVTDRSEILDDDCDFYAGDYQAPSDKLIALGYASKNEIILSNKVSFAYAGNIKDSYYKLYALVTASEGAIFVTTEMADFINRFK